MVGENVGVKKNRWKSRLAGQFSWIDPCQSESQSTIGPLQAALAVLGEGREGVCARQRCFRRQWAAPQQQSVLFIVYLLYLKSTTITITHLYDAVDLSHDLIDGGRWWGWWGHIGRLTTGQKSIARYAPDKGHRRIENHQEDKRLKKR